MGDNGGPLDGAHSNFPLRGGKLNFFEGGVRPAAFVHSPLLPAAVAGTTYEGILHETDWYVWRSRRPVLWAPGRWKGSAWSQPRFLPAAFAPNRVHLPSPNRVSSPNRSNSHCAHSPPPPTTRFRYTCTTRYATFARLAGVKAGEGSSSQIAGALSGAPTGAPVGAGGGSTTRGLQAGIDGVDAWDTLCNGSVAHRNEALISDHILRVGQWKLVTGAARGDTAANWRTGMLKGCMLGTGGGWLAPPTNATNRCPKDIYTGGSQDSIACPDDVAKNKSRYAVTAAVDLWFCSTPCTMDTPCLWDVVADPQERHEVAAANPSVVSTLRARLQELQKGFVGPSSVEDNGNFCAVMKARTVSGVGPMLGPWIGIGSGLGRG